MLALVMILLFIIIIVITGGISHLLSQLCLLHGILLE